ncbi:MAG: hypothetical protein JXR19_03970 [Bacteroidia bacterium]
MRLKSGYLILLALLLVLLLIDYNMFFNHFAKTHADSDQTLFWLYTRDISEGQFRTPYLYGQNYNIPLESILAVPMFLVGMSSYVSLPLMGLLMQLTPFLLLAYFAYKSQSYIACLLSILVGILLPVEWLMMSMPRGFMGGIFVANVGVFVLFNSKAVKSRILGFVLCGLSLLISPNAVILLVPALLGYVILHKVKIGEIILALLPITIIYIGLQWFNTLHANEFVHKSWQIEWSLDYFLKATNHLPEFFKGLFPVFYELGILILAAVVLVAFKAIKSKNRSVIVASTSLLLFVLISLGVNKVNDGTASVFFPYSRMYLALPYVILLLFILLEKRRNSFPSKWTLFIIAILGIVGFTVEQLYASQRINRALTTNSDVVQLFQNSTLEEECLSLEKLMQQQNANLLVVLSKADQYTFGCDALRRLKTVHPAYERRWWLVEEYRSFKLENVIVLDWHQQLAEHFSQNQIVKIESHWPAYRIINSEETVSLFFD